jgi:uncharacterized phage protein (TIGR01671 family)
MLKKGNTMSRELRFRAWSEESECYTCSDNITEQVYGNAVVHPEGTGQFVLDNDVDYLFEQFTGLADKNSRDVYEGDIIRVKMDFQSIVDPPSLSHEICLVEWDREYLAWVIGEEYLSSVKGGDFEVVGNIHKNPDLLGAM